MRRDEALSLLRGHRPRLAELGVTHAYLFGSVAEDVSDADSDVDVMVDLDEGPGGRKPLFRAFDLGAIQYELSELFGRPVDLAVRSDALLPVRRLRAVAERRLVDAF